MAKLPPPVIKPNLGLYLDRPSIAIPPGALQAGNNFRIQLGNYHNLNMGWQPWNSVQLNGPVRLIVNFTNSSGNSFLIFGTLTDLYTFNVSTKETVYINPIYTTGTVAASGTAVTGSGTAWNTTPAGSMWANAKAGDQISFGSSSETDPTATWYTIQGVNSNTSITLDTSAGTIGSGTSYTIRRLFTGAFENPWVYEYFVDANVPVGSGSYGNGEDLIYLTNGVDNVVNWNGSSAQVNLNTGFGFTCKTLVQYSDMMIYGNVLQGADYLGTTILNSDAGAPSNVGNQATGLSSQFIVQSNTDPILQMARLSTYLAIYCNHTVILVSATGAATIFAFRIAGSNKGIIGQSAFAAYPTLHQFIAADGMYYFDGTNVEPINTHVWRQVVSSLDNVRPNNLFTFLDEPNGEVIWSVPQTTDPGAGNVSAPNAQAWTEHYLEETAGQTQSALIASAMGLNRPYSTRTYPFTAVGTWFNETVLTWNQLTNAWNTYNYRWNDSFFSASFPIVLAGDNSGFIYQLNLTQSANGTPLSSSVTFGRRPTVDGRMRAMVRRVYPFMHQFQNPVNITVGLADFAQGPATITQTYSFDQSFSQQGQYMVPVYRRGRWLDLIVAGDSTNDAWTISGYDTDILPGGMR